jgi:hypothetical protein
LNDKQPSSSDDAYSLTFLIGQFRLKLLPQRSNPLPVISDEGRSWTQRAMFKRFNLNLIIRLNGSHGCPLASPSFPSFCRGKVLILHTIHFIKEWSWWRGEDVLDRFALSASLRSPNLIPLLLSGKGSHPPCHPLH